MASSASQTQSKSKTLCKLARSDNEEQLTWIATCEGSRELRAFCKKCGRLAAKKKMLCKPKKLRSADE